MIRIFWDKNRTKMEFPLIHEYFFKWNTWPQKRDSTTYFFSEYYLHEFSG